ncbi:hypothetical protein NL676_003316 [Syzygium grande]|nr:hypothetical protein NL676_003316 [Syzygium grande]
MLHRGFTFIVPFAAVSDNDPEGRWASRLGLLMRSLGKSSTTSDGTTGRALSTAGKGRRLGGMESGRRAPSEEQVIGERSSRGSTGRTQKIGEVELPVDGVALPSSSPSPH